MEEWMDKALVPCEMVTPGELEAGVSPKFYNPA